MRKNMSSQKLTGLPRLLLFICSILLITVLFVPLWQIQLAAPQYPEGLVLKMYPNRIGGNVEIINGLNHYIGMKTLHTEDFIEFTILPYIIIFFAALSLAVASFLKTKKWLITLLVLFILFGIVAMADFWKWEYDYGHNLDPNAAIQVPGMAYQPPLIGYKKLLNFGAFSVPDVGGWLFVTAGVLMVLALILQISRGRKGSLSIKTPAPAIAMLIGMISLASCTTGPQPIRPGIDACSFCKMTIADNRFGAEIITQKGKIFKFDDTHCLLAFRSSDAINANEIKEIYLTDFNEPHDLLEASKVFLLKSADLRSPMGGNIACFTDETRLNTAAEKFAGEKIAWEALLNVDQ